MTHDPLISVLIVDDHPLMRYGVAGEINAQRDMKVVAEAEDGDSALALFREHKPDVTLMDLKMPGMNGIDCLMAIRAEFRQARIIVLTTATGDIQVTRAFKAGAVGFLLKDDSGRYQVLSKYSHIREADIEFPEFRHFAFLYLIIAFVIFFVGGLRNRKKQTHP